MEDENQSIRCVEISEFQSKKRHRRMIEQSSVLKDFTLEQKEVIKLIFDERLNVFLTGENIN